MKNFKKGFTLVEMLIVVVIIGILTAAILPRLQGAQAATRDTARVKYLQDISAGVESYAAVKGEYPAVEGGATPTYSASGSLEDILVKQREYLKNFPFDPVKSSVINVGTKTLAPSGFGYILLKKADNPNRAYALISVAETYDRANATDEMVKAFAEDFDISDLKLCDSIVKGDKNTTYESGQKGKKLKEDTLTASKECQVTDASKLRYVLVR